MSAAPPNSPLVHTALRGTFWSYAGYYGGKAIIFASTLVLVHLLSKDDFGVVGYATTALGLMDVFREMGIGPALIFHRDDPDTTDTAFWLVLVTASVLGLLAAAALAPLAGWYFNDARAVPVTMALAVTYPITALGTVHDSLLSKNLRFRRRFLPELTYPLTKAATSVTLAWLGWGPWSLVLGPIAASVLGTSAVWLMVPWRPRLRFVWAKARALLTYGSHTVLVNAAAMLVLNVDYLLVGRFFGPQVLGAYIIAFRIPELLILQFCYIIAKVIFPVYAYLRDNPSALRHGFLETVRYVPLVTVPMGLGLALVARPFVQTFFPSHWADTIPIIRAIAVYAVMLSLAYNAGDVYKAQGRPLLLTWLTLFRLALLAPALWWAVVAAGTIVAVGWAQATVALLGGMLNLIVAGWLLNIPFRQILRALFPAVVCGAVMSAAVALTLLGLAYASPPAQLAAGVLMGVFTYTLALRLIEPQVVRTSVMLVRGAWLGK